MFVPYHDDTPLKVIRFQWMTGAIIVVNVAIFLFVHYGYGDSAQLAVMMNFGLIPIDVTSLSGLRLSLVVPEPLTYITYQFLHDGWLHLITNMLFLWVFADNIEDVFGHWAFLVFYLICGIGAGVAHTLASPQSGSPLIGASGAVAGVLASYLVLFPRARVWILLFMRLPLRIPAFYVIGGWIILQIVSLFLSTEQDLPVAWWAHIGGFALGLALTFLLRSRLMTGSSP